MADPDLVRAHEDVQALSTARRRLANCGQQLSQVEAAVAVLQRQHAKERADVDVLNRTSLRRVLTKLAGNHDEKLAAEEAEAAAVGIRLDGQRARLAQIRGDRDALQQQVNGLADAPQRLEAALAAGQQRLIDGGGPSSAAMHKLVEQIGQNRAVEREHVQARDAGTNAVAAVKQVQMTLQKALGWSTGDMFNMPFADWAEHDRLDEAAAMCWQAQGLIDVFAREMADVALDVSVRMPEVDTRRFADMFFDNIITDSMRHRRIQETVDYVNRVERYLNGLLNEVGVRLARIKSTAQSLEDQRRTLLGLGDTA